MRIKQETTDLNGHKLLLRNPERSDAEQLLEYLRVTSQETRFLLREPDELPSLDNELEFIDKQNSSESSLFLMAFLDGEFTGCCSFQRHGRKRSRHRATVAIALYKKFTHMGIGGKMFEKLFFEAKKIGLEQLELVVMSDNLPALNMYLKHGFEITGKQPHYMKYADGTYVDAYYMVKKLGDA